MIQPHGTKSHMLVSKLRSGTSKTMQLVPVHLDLLCNLLTSMCDFVLCDRIVQRAYYFVRSTFKGQKMVAEQ